MSNIIHGYVVSRIARVVCVTLLRQRGDETAECWDTERAAAIVLAHHHVGDHVPFGTVPSPCAQWQSLAASFARDFLAPIEPRRSTERVVVTPARIAAWLSGSARIDGETLPALGDGRREGR